MKSLRNWMKTPLTQQKKNDIKREKSRYYGKKVRNLFRSLVRSDHPIEAAEFQKIHSEIVRNCKKQNKHRNYIARKVSHLFVLQNKLKYNIKI